MAKKTKPKENYGYYCDLCGNKICKYSLDFSSCGGHQIPMAHKKTDKQEVDYAEICHDCLKVIAEEGVDSL